MLRMYLFEAAGALLTRVPKWIGVEGLGDEARQAQRASQGQGRRRSGFDCDACRHRTPRSRAVTESPRHRGLPSSVSRVGLGLELAYLPGRRKHITLVGRPCPTPNLYLLPPRPLEAKAAAKSLRIASDRLILTPCSRIQSSTSPRTVSGSLSGNTGICPVAGRPRLFFSVLRFFLDIAFSVLQKIDINPASRIA
jgi:hypothetical protein